VKPMVDHIHITVSDFERAEKFYDKLMPLLGFDLANKETDVVPEHAFFFKDSEGIEYEIVNFNRAGYFN